jgi:stalled ribosome rescue protein Dom34
MYTEEEVKTALEIVALMTPPVLLTEEQFKEEYNSLSEKMQKLVSAVLMANKAVRDLREFVDSFAD